MRKVKKLAVSFLSMVFIASSLITATAFAVTDGGEKENVKKQTSDEFLLGGWIQFYNEDIKSYDDQLKDLAKSGMNLLDLPNNFSSKSSNSITDSADFWTHLDGLSQEYNMNYLYYDKSDPYNFNSAYEKVKDLKNCVGYHLKDEPSSALLNSLSETYKQFAEGDTTRFPFVNMYPSYAGATNLGGTYRDYLTKWVNLAGSDNLEYLYYDHYPFTQTETVRSTYFSDLEAVRDTAYTNGRIKTGGFTQMGSWNGMTRPTEDMARWSTYSLLSYGIKSISHFCWVAPTYVSPENGGEGMRDFVTDSQGNPTDLYYPMSILNWQVRQLGPILMNMDVKHAYHTASVPTGAEALPSGFILQPGNAADNFVYSLAYSKDDSQTYILVFNKNLDGNSKEYSFNVDTETGIQGLTYYKPTDFTMDTLPDSSDLSTLGSPEEIYKDVSSGSFTDTFKPGEMKVYKVDGENVKINEDLEVPTCSHKSGIYSGTQNINLSTGDNAAKIYYTLDGSFPEVGKDGTYLYENPVSVGSYGESGTYTLRAVSKRGSDVSEVLNVDLMITDSSRNVAEGISGKFMSADMSREISYSGFNGSPTNIKNMTDGSLDPCASVLNTNELGWAVLDLGKEYNINKILFSMWHDWWFAGVKVQVAENSDFSDAYTVYEAASMQNNPSGGTTVTFDPRNVRYIRVTNNAKGEGNSTVITEIEAFTYMLSGTDILADTGSWSAIGGGVFDNSGTVIKESEAYQTANWDKAYSYNAKKYKNFIIDATMSINVSDSAAWGYAGFQIYRKSTATLQSNVNDGLIVGVEPKGRALIWNGAKEVGALDANIAGWNVGSEFSLKIIAYNGIIAIAVNNKPIMYVESSDFDREAGYISLHTGLLPVTVTSLKITGLDDSFALPVKYQAVKSAEETKIAVERYMSETDVIAKLNGTVKVTDSAGNEFSIGVKWSSENYDRTKTGTFDFIGTLSQEDLDKNNLSNAYSVKAYGKVFVKSAVDTTVIDGLLSLAASLNEYEYTADSWQYLQLKISAAQTILNDPFLVQSDINVGSFQLYDAIYKDLVYSADTTDLQTAIDTAKTKIADDYTENSFAVLTKALSDAEQVTGETFKTYATVNSVKVSLTNALSGLEAKEKVINIDAEKPDIKEITTKTGCSGEIDLCLSLIILLAAFLFIKH